MADLKNNTVNEQWARLQAVIDHYGVSVYQFSKCLGLKSPENLYRIKHGKNGISWHLAERISECCPEVRKCWILCGEGAMLKTPSQRE